MPDRASLAHSLLRGVLPDHLLTDRLDPGYREAAERRGGAPARGPAQVAWLVAGALVAGLLFGVAARNAAALAPATDQTVRGLAAEVAQARQRGEELSRQAAALADQVDAARAGALAGDAAGQRVLGEVADLEVAAAAVPVTGEGLRITVADPPAAQGAPTAREQTVLDRDLQLLVNALWSAGAEAIALGGVRLHPLATVRQAGGAMLVDNRPVGQPYLFEVLGDREELQVNLLDTDGYGRFHSFAQIYDTEFRIEPADRLTLPAGSARTHLAVPAPTPTAGGDR